MADARAALLKDKRVVLRGLRGVGKTAIVAALTFELRANYDIVWWIDASNEGSVRASLIGLGVRVLWIDRSMRESEAVQQVINVLRDTDQRILLVLDDALDFQSLQPRALALAAADIMVTSNSSAWRRFADVVEVQPWSPELGATFLVERTGEFNSPNVAGVLSNALGGLPLAMEQAGAYCEHFKLPLAEYLKRFQTQPLPLLDDIEHADPGYRNVATTVARTFALAIAAANVIDPAAELLLVRLSLLAEAAIPTELIVKGREWFSADLAGRLIDDGIDRVLAALATFALVDVASALDDTETRFMQIHRLVRIVAASRYPELDRPTLVGEWLQSLRQLYPNDVDDDPSTWPLARRLDPHLSVILSETVSVPQGHEVEASWLLDRQATYRHLVQADYVAAESLHRRALEIDEAQFGPMHQLVAADLNNLAELKRGIGQLREAEDFYLRASTIYGQNPTEHASRLANIDNNRAELLRGRGDFNAAEPLYRQAIALEECRPEPDYISLAKYHGNLGILLAATERPLEAEDEIVHGLVINVRLFGKYHPSVAGDLNTFAGLMRETGRYERAERIYRSALKIAVTCLPPRHPHLAIHMTNFAEF